MRLSVGRADLSSGNTATRTALYGTYSRIANKGAQNFAFGSTTPTLPNGQKSQGIEAGLRHSF